MSPEGALSTELLRHRIENVEAELRSLRALLAKAERAECLTEPAQYKGNPELCWKWPLQACDYERYARQLVLPSIGVRGQLRLKQSSVLVVGAGGLGCPAAIYLAGAGIGRIGIVDGDTVELSNLHRQIGHSARNAGMPKASSLVDFMRSLNENVQYTAYDEHITSSNAFRLINAYDVILDCTDHPAVRYLISDMCVLAMKPLVSAAALRTDGQIAVLNWPPGSGPCYRCVFPRPPPAASQLSCAEGGILGPVVGVMGVLQAFEALRTVVELDRVKSTEAKGLVQTQQVSEQSTTISQPTMLLFTAGSGDGTLGDPTFRAVRLRGQRADCFACSKDSKLQKMHSLMGSSTEDVDCCLPDYVQFCGGDEKTETSLLAPEERISAVNFSRLWQENKCIEKQTERLWLIDVREKEYFDMGSIEGSINIPISRIKEADMQGRKNQNPPKAKDLDGISVPDWIPRDLLSDSSPIYVICRVGNDSQAAVEYLKRVDLSKHGSRFIGDINGGIREWKRAVDATMPFV